MESFNFVPPGKGQKCDIHAKPFLSSNAGLVSHLLIL